jgi:hypothetical protein
MNKSASSESTSADAPATALSPAPANPQRDAKTPQQQESRKARKQATPASADEDETIMKQYRSAKEKHPDMLLLFRMGDYFELFGQDAEIAHKLLGLTLTMRDRTLTMVGFPHHQLETYLHKLIREGHRVAICEPAGESLARGPIRREVTRVVTPGTLFEEESGEANESKEEELTPANQPVRQPRRVVLKRCEDWFNQAGLAFVTTKKVTWTAPGVTPFIAILDFIVLRGEDKLLVTVRPRLPANHLNSFRELQGLFGSEYKSVRIWPSVGPDGWIWDEYLLDN